MDPPPTFAISLLLLVFLPQAIHPGQPGEAMWSAAPLPWSFRHGTRRRCFADCRCYQSRRAPCSGCDRRQPRPWFDRHAGTAGTARGPAPGRQHAACATRAHTHASAPTLCLSMLCVVPVSYTGNGADVRISLVSKATAIGSIVRPSFPRPKRGWDGRNAARSRPPLGGNDGNE